MIIVKNLSLKFTKEFYALFEINLEIKKGEAVAFFGPEFSGKTTMLRVLAGLEKPNSGEVYIKEIPLKKINFECDINMGYIPASPVFFEKKSVYENLYYLLKVRETKRSEIEDKINKLLIEYNLEKLKDEKVSKLSLFDKYLLSIARLSFRSVEIVLIDNIFEKLSKEELERIKELIKKEFLEKKVTTIIATTSQLICKDLTKRTIKFKLGSIEA
ncbi:MAG: ATP-binding cassette domain-containing protein [Clostridia bacterium]|nr:ATP-binding cassette domain-containing protein [Clostridia bacterium]